MASARSEACGSPQGLKHNYAHPHNQISSPPKREFLCGAPSCTRLALIWLTDDQEEQYVQGVRLFRVAQSAEEVRIN